MQLAQPIGDPNLPRPWSRHSEGSSAFVTTSRNKDEDPTTSGVADGGPGNVHGSKSTLVAGQIENDPQLNEFLEVMQHRSKSKLWANDTTLASGVGTETGSKKGKKRVGDELNLKASVEVKTVETFSRRVPINKGKGGAKLKQMHVRFEGSDSDGSDDDELYEDAPLLDRTELREIGQTVEGDDVTTSEKDPVVQSETVSDLDYLKSRVKGGNWSEDEDDAGDKDTTKKEDVINHGGSSGEDDEDDEDDDKNEEEAEEEDDSEGHDTKMVETDNNVVIAETGLDEDEHRDHDMGKASEVQEKGVQVLAEEQEGVAETGRLFIRNLPYTARYR